MSQMCVERVIGLLVTDEGLRKRFKKNPRMAIKEMTDRGMELTGCEQWALMRLDAEALMSFARNVDGRLQRIDGGEWR